MKIFNLIFLKLIIFYQKYITVLSFGSCRYIPTCSHYAHIQFEQNNFFKAFFLTILRILKCNKLFIGGFDYPKIKYNTTKAVFKKIKVKYWLIPTDDGYYLVVKNWKRNIIN